MDGKARVVVLGWGVGGGWGGTGIVGVGLFG